MKFLFLLPILLLTSCAIEGVGKAYYLNQGDPAPEAGILYAPEKKGEIEISEEPK